MSKSSVLGRMGPFTEQLSGGKPNSLGNTESVVEQVLHRPERFDELFDCYFCDDELVRLRTSNALKRISKQRSALILPYLDRLIDEVAYIPQPSTQWTLAQLLLHYDSSLSAKQRLKAVALLKRPFDNAPEPAVWHDDWIVLNMTMATLQYWSKTDDDLRKWYIPHLERLSKDARKSVRGRAQKYLAAH